MAPLLVAVLLCAAVSRPLQAQFESLSTAVEDAKDAASQAQKASNCPASGVQFCGILGEITGQLPQLVPGTETPPKQQAQQLSRLGGQLVNEVSGLTTTSSGLHCKPNDGTPRCRELSAVIDSLRNVEHETIIADLQLGLAAANAAPKKNSAFTDLLQNIAVTVQQTAQTTLNANLQTIPEHDPIGADDGKEVAQCLNSAKSILKNSPNGRYANTDQAILAISSLADLLQLPQSQEGAGRTAGNSFPGLTLMLNLLALALLGGTLAAMAKQKKAAKKAAATDKRIAAEITELSGMVQTTLSQLRNVTNEYQQVAQQLSREATRMPQDRDQDSGSPAETVDRALAEGSRVRQESSLAGSRATARGATPSEEDLGFPGEGVVIGEEVTSSIPATVAEPEPRRAPSEFTGNPLEDYNSAKGRGEDARDRFKAKYKPRPVVCANLANRGVSGAALIFKEEDRGNLFTINDERGGSWVFPQFGLHYRISKSMLDGIFTYPANASENLQLHLPGYLRPSGDGWILERPGVFVDG